MSTLPSSIPLSLTPEMRQALAASGGASIQLADPETQKVYLLTEQTQAALSHDEYVQQKLEAGLADFAAGRFEPWDIEKTISKAREAFSAKSQ
jgi:hypothetical protein